MMDAWNLISGKQAEGNNEAGLTTNKNMIPFDKQNPRVTSGIRLGTAAMTTRGFKENEFRQVANWIHQICQEPENTELKSKVLTEVKELSSRYGLVEGE